MSYITVLCVQGIPILHAYGHLALPACWNGHDNPPVHHGSTCAWSCSIPCQPEWTWHSTCPPWQYMCMVMWPQFPADRKGHLSTMAVHVHGHVAFPAGRNGTCPPWQYMCMVMWHSLPAGMDTACPPWHVQYMCTVMWRSLPAGMDTAFHLSTVAVHVQGHVAFPAGRNGHGIPPVHRGSSCAWSCGVFCQPEWTRHSTCPL